MLRIDEILTKKGISSGEFARMLDVSTTTASGLRSGRSRPTVERLYKISQILDVEVRELFKPGKGGDSLNGFIEYKGNIYKINTLSDLEDLMDIIREN